MTQGLGPFTEGSPLGVRINAGRPSTRNDSPGRINFLTESSAATATEVAPMQTTMQNRTLLDRFEYCLVMRIPLLLLFTRMTVIRTTGICTCRIRLQTSKMQKSFNHKTHETNSQGEPGCVSPWILYSANTDCWSFDINHPAFAWFIPSSNVTDEESGTSRER